MSQMNQECMTAIQPELVSGENVLWTGNPNTSVVFHKEDLYLIPFSLMFGGFTILWESLALGLIGATEGAPLWFALWGIPFVIAGQYLIWGRFFFAAWKKHKTVYAVTNRRAIAVQDVWNKKAVSIYLELVPNLIKEGGGSDGIGTLRFAPAPVFTGRRNGQWGVWDSMHLGNTPVFRDIDNIQSVFRLVCEQRDRLRETKPAFHE